MAIVSSRKAIHLKDIDRLNQKRTQILDNVCIFKYSDKKTKVTKVYPKDQVLCCRL